MLTLEQLAELANSYPSEANTPVETFSIRNHEFDFNRHPAIMGVVNLSGESWYRESVCLTTEMAIRRARVLRAQGADIVDIGAESTLADADRVEEELQQNRLLPVIRELAREGALISVETYHRRVTEACLNAGASLLNLTGTVGTEEFFRLVSDHDAAVILCFVQGPNVREVDEFDFTRDPVIQMYDYFSRQLDLAARFGVRKVFLDPGLGFYYRNLQDSAHRVRHQIQVFLNSFRIRSLGFPIAHALPHAFEFFGEEVRTAESFFAVLAALGKTDLFRTHEVPKVKAVLDTLNAA